MTQRSISPPIPVTIIAVVKSHTVIGQEIGRAATPGIGQGCLCHYGITFGQCQIEIKAVYRERRHLTEYFPEFTPKT
jgi:hypothetical protein